MIIGVEVAKISEMASAVVVFRAAMDRGATELEVITNVSRISGGDISILVNLQRVLSVLSEEVFVSKREDFNSNFAILIVLVEVKPAQ